MWKDVEPAVGAGFPVRVMTYNLHQGFDVHGRHGMEELARIIEDQDPDIIALQEVSRGMGHQRFRRYARLALAASRNGLRVGSGSRFGVGQRGPQPVPRSLSSGTTRCPTTARSSLTGRFLTAEVDVGGGETLVVIATHFHAGDGDSAVRVPQARAVLEAVDSDRTTVLLGDLNARPDHPEMLLITSAGLNDTFVASGTSGDGLTSPADAPTERIDYVWASPDLKVRDFLIPHSLASDHFAVAITLYR